MRIWLRLHIVFKCTGSLIMYKIIYIRRYDYIRAELLVSALGYATGIKLAQHYGNIMKVYYYITPKVPVLIWYWRTGRPQ